MSDLGADKAGKGAAFHHSGLSELMNGYNAPWAVIVLGVGVVAALLSEVIVLAEMMVGFGLGSVVGTSIVVLREYRKRPVRVAYTIGGWSLIGAGVGIAAYLLAELP